MKSRIAKCLFPVLVALFSATDSHAQKLIANEGEYVSYGTNQAAILGEVKEQTSLQSATAVEQGTINLQFNSMLRWQQQLNNYLKNATGYAEILKNSVSIYQESVQVFLSLGQLYADIKDSPKGFITTGIMTDLITETLSECVSVYGSLANLVAKENPDGEMGGKSNMLNANDRVQIVYDIRDKLRTLHRKINNLDIAVRSFTFSHLWDNTTSRFWSCDKKEALRQARSHFKQSAKAAARRY